jgi:carbon-monoxide dehydrogenase small subunit
MKQLITLKVNGEKHEVAVEPHKTLLEILRYELQLTGTKEGCGGLGQCGTCTVIMDGKAVNSCLVLAMDARDKEVLTIEGVSSPGKLHPIQQALLEYGAVQCGFCGPGIVLSAVALFDKNPNPSEDEIKTAIAGNLCRCTGYAKRKEALMAVAENYRERKV